MFRNVPARVLIAASALGIFDVVITVNYVMSHR
jgi:hypothetical protein